MKIVDFKGDKIQACFSMFYLGYEISCSTVMSVDHCEVAIFENDEFIDRAIGVANAMEVIDERVAKCTS